MIAAFAVLAATIVIANAVSPLRSAAPIAYDTSAIVLQFDRIVTGRIMEVPILTTPKPLLSVIYGPIWEITHDWRPIVWSAVLALAVSAALATILVSRIAGLGAGVFAGVAIATSSMLMWEALRGLATPWAVLGWMIAGLAITAERPRYWLVGVALMLATMARIETLILLAVATVALVVMRFGPARLRRPVPRAAWFVLIGFMALPVMLIHDWLLIRDPLYWAGVSGRYAATHPATSGFGGVVRVLRVLRVAVAPMIGMVALGGIGVALMWRQRQWLLLIAILSITAGVAAFLLMIGYLGYAVPVRYAAPAVVTLMLAAALCYGGLRIGPLRGDPRRRSTTHGALGGDLADPAPAADRPFPLLPGRVSGPLRTAAVVLGGIVAAVSLAGPIAGQGVVGGGEAGGRRTLADAARANREIHEGATLAIPALRAAAREADAAPREPGAPPLIVVPGLLGPRMALDLGLSLTEVEGVRANAPFEVANGRPAPGQIVLYERVTDLQGLRAALAVATPTEVDGVVLDPLFVDSTTGTWVVRIRPR